MTSKRSRVQEAKQSLALTEPGPDRSYYRRLSREVRKFEVDLPAKKWCDLWHTHFDWDGYGDRGWLDRRRHLRALFVALTRARRELAAQSIPYQLFAAVYPASSSDDALYVHTENPNSTPFPFEFPDTQPTAGLPPLLATFVDPRRYRVLKSNGSRGICYLVVA
jgi:hypothetical protein